MGVIDYLALLEKIEKDTPDADCTNCTKPFTQFMQSKDQAQKGAGTVAVANTADLKTVIANTSDISSNAPAPVTKIEKNTPDTDCKNRAKPFAQFVQSADQAQKDESFQERAAILEFDGQLDRESAEQCAHDIVFCKDCLHHIPQPDSISRSGNTHATPSGCDLGLIAPDSWPPIYSFTAWRCPRYSETPKMRALNSMQ